MVCDDEIMGDGCDGVYGAGSIVIEENKYNNIIAHIRYNDSCLCNYSRL